jgi:hypothetical protein
MICLRVNMIFLGDHRLIPNPRLRIVLFEYAGRISTHHGIVWDVFGYNAASGYNAVFANADACYDHGIGAYPGIVPDPDQPGLAGLIFDRNPNVLITVVKAGNADVLGKDHVAPDFHGPDDNAAYAD